MTKIHTYARLRLHEPITLAELAKLVRMSRFNFVRTYHRLSGQPPMTDIRALRMERARELLLTTDLGLKEIAPRCGLQSAFSLSRAFKRHFGYGPSLLRRQA